MQGTLQAYTQALTSALASGYRLRAVTIACNLAGYQMIQGKLDQALRTCEQAMEWATVRGFPTPAAGYVQMEIGEILYERNELQAAEKASTEGIHLLSQAGITLITGIDYALLARIKQAQGDPEEALQIIHEAIRIASASRIAHIVSSVDAYQARIWLAQGKIELASAWADTYLNSGPAEYIRDFEDLTLARVLLAKGKPREALNFLMKLLGPSEARGRGARVIENLVLQALALEVLKENELALEALCQALRLAEPDGFVRIFIDEGEPMRLLFESLRKQDQRSSDQETHFPVNYLNRVMPFFSE
jgi:LuxR family maltose regulon positive regulatory protein